MRVGAWVMSRPRLYAFAGRWVRRLWPLITLRLPGNPVGAWLKERDLPPAPGESFRDRWKQIGRPAAHPRPARQVDRQPIARTTDVPAVRSAAARGRRAQGRRVPEAAGPGGEEEAKAGRPWMNAASSNGSGARANAARTRARCPPRPTSAPGSASVAVLTAVGGTLPGPAAALVDWQRGHATGGPRWRPLRGQRRGRARCCSGRHRLVAGAGRRRQAPRPGRRRAGHPHRRAGGGGERRRAAVIGRRCPSGRWRSCRSTWWCWSRPRRWWPIW